jgi:hypothetical protein
MPFSCMFIFSDNYAIHLHVVLASAIFLYLSFCIALRITCLPILQRYVSVCSALVAWTACHFVRCPAHSFGGLSLTCAAGAYAAQACSGRQAAAGAAHRAQRQGLGRGRARTCRTAGDSAVARNRRARRGFISLPYQRRATPALRARATCHCLPLPPRHATAHAAHGWSPGNRGNTWKRLAARQRQTPGHSTCRAASVRASAARVVPSGACLFSRRCRWPSRANMAGRRIRAARLYGAPRVCALPT